MTPVVVAQQCIRNPCTSPRGMDSLADICAGWYDPNKISLSLAPSRDRWLTLALPMSATESSTIIILLW
eukprot:CAMPEP_0183317474 /NCGR_PEP_ID=MMETSP0160_2-20130417/58010_1 /TAXON_ID=2839 ORGANISM="Odontella Sinensis, Strain Grunow 1884" /NCGR_SAMPLE_ID=MMETSP0160_2 /ASSEMBLY_ACC=CAM_ASM_000250 /LENGTH=68 /DNA_ID=CAMNT_0025483497 /DNA_START=187 /DNA_END=390 /DNA_ORIENTATION=+